MSLDPKQFPPIPPVDSSDRPFWSVIVPAYKARFLEQALRSVLDQDSGADRMEILVVDDCSPDALEPIVRRVGGDRIRYIRNSENRGTHATENAGVSLARGIWTHILNDDDLVSPGFYEVFRAALEDQPESVGAASCLHKNIGQNGEERSITAPLAPAAGVLRDWIRRIGKSNQVHPVAVVVRRAVYERIGGFHLNLKYCADWEFNKRLACHFEWWFEPRVMASYRVHRDAVTARMRRTGEHIDDLARAIEISESYLPENLRGPITAAAREYYALCALSDALWFLKRGMGEAGIALARGAFRLSDDPRTAAEFEKVLSHPAAGALRELGRESFRRDWIPKGEFEPPKIS